MTAHSIPSTYHRDLLHFWLLLAPYPGSVTMIIVTICIDLCAAFTFFDRDVGFMSCVIDGSSVQPFLEVLGAESVSIT